ncbi:MAG TPA: ABC transporter ATP-binding protein [Nocardioides sp.]|jgi:putative ABC transport system ATP-binding protein|uniref:ABC transporter ATP-binding protein n=1 Tax=Nocardioides sp. TaxID=35761 RepID=UPI002B522108|nr:ABC transporter ATP-binding protein [Nocardioides sp.]HTW17356.1 ABC transporter ATP-binding protein [Nocardioides sp.]
MSPTPEPLLSGLELRKSFGSTTALNGASIEVRAGEIVAVTGPSGSGKSTLLHCLAGVLVPEVGTLTYRGSRLDHLPADERTRLRRVEFGLVLQFGLLVPELTALENVALPLLLERRRRTDARAAAMHWLDRLGVGDVAQSRADQMSGGQAQRVAIARALVTGPQVVFADEPTGALDTLTGERTLEVLLGAVRETGAALVVVTHDNRVAAHAEREVVLRDGTTEHAGASR